MDIVLKGLLQGSIPVVVFVGGAHHLTKKLKASKPVLYYGSLLAGLGLAYAVVEGKIKVPFMNAEGDDLYYCSKCDEGFSSINPTDEGQFCDSCLPSSATLHDEMERITMDAEMKYDGAKRYLRGLSGRFEGANDEGFFPAEEEDFEEMIIDEIGEHTELDAETFEADEQRCPALTWRGEPCGKRLYSNRFISPQLRKIGGKNMMICGDCVSSESYAQGLGEWVDKYGNGSRLDSETFEANAKNSKKINLTEKEFLVLILVNKDWVDNEWEDGGASFWHDEMDMKKMRGVLSSLVKKGIITANEEFVNKNKYTLVHVNDKYTKDDSINWNMFECPQIVWGYETFIEWANKVPKKMVVSIIMPMMDEKNAETLGAETFNESVSLFEIKIPADSYDSGPDAELRSWIRSMQQKGYTYIIRKGKTGVMYDEEGNKFYSQFPEYLIFDIRDIRDEKGWSIADEITYVMEGDLAIHPDLMIYGSKKMERVFINYDANVRGYGYVKPAIGGISEYIPVMDYETFQKTFD